MGWLEAYPHSVFASALLSDGKLIAWKVGNPAKETVGDFYKVFFYADKNPSDFNNVTIQTKEFVCENEGDHNAKMKEAEIWLATSFEAHENHMGVLPSKRENLFEYIERTGNSPYLEFIHSSPEELAEKLLKASCCYCYYGKDGEMTCSNKEGAHCKAGILAYLTGKTLD